MKLRKRNSLLCVGMVCLLLLGGCEKGTVAREPDRSEPEAASRMAFARTSESCAESTDEKIYIQPFLESSGVVSLNLESGETTVLNLNESDSIFSKNLVSDGIQIVDGRLYAFVKGTNYKNPALYRMDLDGSNIEKITEISEKMHVLSGRVIGDEMYFFGVPIQEDGSVEHLYRQRLTQTDAEPEEILLTDEDDGAWAFTGLRSLVAEEEQGVLYFERHRHQDDGQEETTVWMYDTAKEQAEKIFETNRDVSYFVKDGWVYYSECTYREEEPTEYDTIQRQNIQTGEVENTGVAGGKLIGCDADYYYVETHEKEYSTDMSNIEVYKLDGTPVETLRVAAHDTIVGTTYDAIVIHDYESSGSSEFSEIVYVYDKSQIGTGEGEWKEVTIKCDSDEKVAVEIVQR